MRPHGTLFVKRTFTLKALSFKRPKEVWRVIHWILILHPSPQPLCGGPEELRMHFASTADRVTGGYSAKVFSILFVLFPMTLIHPFY